MVFHTARLFQPKSLERGLDRLQAMAAQAATVAELVALAEPDLIIFSCTSCSFFAGRAFDREIAQSIERATGIAALTPPTAAVAALEALGRKRIFMALPYPDAILATAIRYMEEAGFVVVGHVRFDCRTSSDVTRVTPAAVAARIVEQRDRITGADAVFISGTGFRGMEAVVPLEAVLDRPVVSANSATIWFALRHLGMDQSGVAAGRLFRLSTAAASRSTA